MEHLDSLNIISASQKDSSSWNELVRITTRPSGCPIKYALYFMSSCESFLKNKVHISYTSIFCIVYS
jgi:hypothetical protein